MIGKLISHYKILEKLGEGGMGVVYKAEDTKLKRTVALKFLPPEFTRDRDAKERFMREAQTAAKLDHSNICTIHEVQETETGQLFIVMACYEGDSLKEKIEKGPLKLETAINIAIQITQGLAKAHEEGIVHRDIKSANIHLTPDRVVKILDFGLAKLGDRMNITKENTTLGTITHMSPEQVCGEKVDNRSDIWSLGVVLYNMITGLLPFKGDYQPAVEYAIINENPEIITGLRTGVPVELERIVNKMLTKNPDERYQHVEDLLVDLKNVKAELSSTGKTVTTKVIQKTSPKKSLIRTVSAAGFVIILALIFFIFKSTFVKDDFIEAKIPIAVMPFENRTGDDSLKDLSETIQDLLITKLGNSEYLYVMTRERMNDLLKQMDKQGATIDKELGYELCRRDSVETIIIGSINKAGDTFITDVKVLDVESKALIGSASEHGEGKSSLFTNQIDKLGDKISSSAGLTARKIAANQKPIVEMTTSNTEAYMYFVKGRSEFDNSNYEEARVFLEKAVQIDSTFATAQLYLGMSYYFLRNTNAFKHAYEMAKSFSHKAPKKERLFIDAGYAWDIDRNREKAFEIYRLMVAEYPKEKFPYFFLGWDYRRGGLFTEAIASFNKALKLDPQFGWAYEELASTYYRMRDFEKAIYILKQYASVLPGHTNSYDQLGDLYFQIGQLDEAIFNYKEAVNIQPEYRSNWKIAYIYALKEDYAEATSWIDKYIMKARSLGPQGEGLWWKAFYNMWTGQFDQSINEIYQLKGLVENFADDYIQASLDWTLAWIYHEHGDYENSYLLFKEWATFSQERNSPSYTYYAENFYLGMVDLGAGRIDSATSKFNNASTEKYHTYHDLYHNIFYSELLLAQNSLDKAISIQKTIKPFVNVSTLSTDYLANYNVPFMKDVFARAYYKKGEINKAITEYERLINFDPNSWERFLIHPKYHYRLAKLYEEKGNPQKAINEYEKFLDIWKDADKDLSELIDAKTRYAKLTGGT